MDQDETIKSEARQDVEQYGVDDTGHEYAALVMYLEWGIGTEPTDRHAAFIRRDALEVAIRAHGRNPDDFVEIAMEEAGL